MSGETPIVENNFLFGAGEREKSFLRHRGLSVPYEVTIDGMKAVLNETADAWVLADSEVSESGTKFITIRRSDVETSIGDEAKIEIPPRDFTPPQIVTREGQFFSEVPTKGKLALLLVSPQGDFSANFFDVAEFENSGFKGYIGKGWIMSWFSFETEKTASVIEYSEPGFVEGDLLRVPDNSAKADGTVIPGIFWETRMKLKEGKIEFPKK